jgi:hypothetical protein
VLTFVLLGCQILRLIAPGPSSKIEIEYQHPKQFQKFEIVKRETQTRLTLFGTWAFVIEMVSGFGFRASICPLVSSAPLGATVRLLIGHTTPGTGENIFARGATSLDFGGFVVALLRGEANLSAARER